MRAIEQCRVCGGPISLVLSLGDQYVSDFPRPGDSDGSQAPLDLMLCSTCHLVQLRHTVPADTMYRNYWYRSGTNETMRRALSDIANKAEALIHLRERDVVLDIGCNDGTLLGSYGTPGIFRIGFDPAENLAPFSLSRSEHVVVGYFDAEAFRRNPALGDRHPKVVTSIAMFYDIEDPGSFVDDVRRVMHPDGVWVVQMSYLPLMIKQNEIGNICHEHLAYYSLHSLEYLLNIHDMEVVDAELNPVNGGSLRTYIRVRGASPEAFGDPTYRRLAQDRVQALRDREVTLNLASPQPYSDFAFRVDRIKRDIVDFVKEQVGRGKRVFVYGASTKGNTVLQYFGLDHSLLAAAADRNPDKWGRVTVGTHIPIVPEEDARRANPEYFLVLPWHFLDEFVEREKDYLQSGGRFIVPAPYFSLI